MARRRVVGAGAFGGWTALHLLRRGARVTLLDAKQRDITTANRR